MLQMDLARIVQVYVVQGVACVFFLIIAYKILKRDRKRLNLIFSLAYLCIVIGMIINFIYAPLTDVNTVLILNFLVNYFVSFAPIFLVVFNLILLKSEKIITSKKQLAIILAYGALLFGMIFFLPFGGITINESTGWKPVWSVPFFIYVITILTIFAFIPNLYYSIRIYKELGDFTLKKKWKYYIIGICGAMSIIYGTYTSNTLNIQIFRMIWSLLSLSIFVWFYLIYYGVGRQIE